jgi:hypothetical protein
LIYSGRFVGGGECKSIAIPGQRLDRDAIGPWEDMGQVKLLLETVAFCDYLQASQGLNFVRAHRACKFQVLLKLQEAASHAKDTGLRH